MYKKLNELNSVKNWITNNPEKLLGGVIALASIRPDDIALKLYAIDDHDIVINKSGEQEGMKILDIIDDEIEKRN